MSRLCFGTGRTDKHEHIAGVAFARGAINERSSWWREASFEHIAEQLGSMVVAK